jgi:hypothetical protein
LPIFRMYFIIFFNHFKMQFVIFAHFSNAIHLFSHIIPCINQTFFFVKNHHFWPFFLCKLTIFALPDPPATARRLFADHFIAEFRRLSRYKNGSGGVAVAASVAVGCCLFIIIKKLIFFFFF